MTMILINTKNGKESEKLWHLLDDIKQGRVEIDQFGYGRVSTVQIWTKEPRRG